MTVALTQKDFYRQLTVLQQRFDAMQAELEVTVRDPALAVEGYVVVWNTAISAGGPLPDCAKGGTRIRAGLSLDEVKMLARNMAIKNAAADLPLGGAKSGLNADPNAEGFEQQYRRFIELCRPFTYENGGPFGGFGFDLGARAEHALWACDVMKSTRSFTGKPLHMGGTDYDREGIAGLGVAESAAAMLEQHKLDSASTRFAIQGLGAMGAAVLRYFSDYGASLFALGDPKYGGTWHFDGGISDDLRSALVRQQLDKARRLIEQEGDLISHNANEVLYADVDVLFPCALQQVITADNEKQIQARYIVEAANNPTEMEAGLKLCRRGVQQMPDFIANAGGVIAAFVELTSTVSNEENVRTAAKVNEAKLLTREKIRSNVEAITHLSEQFNTSLRDAALYIALGNIFQT